MQAQRRDDAKRWVGTWTTAAQPAFATPAEYNDQTLRLIAHASIAGEAARVRISNTYGSNPLVIGGARLARWAAGAAIQERTSRSLTFGGHGSATISPGALAVSDPVDFAVEALADLAISVYLPQSTKVETDHLLALQTNYVSQHAGDLTVAVDLPGASPISSWPLVTGVDVQTSARGGAIIAFGDSFVDGAASSPDTNQRWPDLLAARLQDRADTAQLGVLNQGIVGNRLLYESPADKAFHGAAGLARFDSDVLAQPGVDCVIVLFGINDLGFAGSVTPMTEQVGTDDLIAGYRELIERAHHNGIRAIGTTITPFQEAISAVGFYTPEKDAVRAAVNDWLLTSGEFDGIVDFDEALRDPDHPGRLRSEFDSGDHMHPNDAGHKAMADAVDLELLARATMAPANR